jgi:hypothetical protein
MGDFLMHRNIIKLISVVSSIVLVSSFGCGTGKSVGVTRSTVRTGELEVAKYWPRQEVKNLSRSEKDRLLKVALVGLRGNNWEGARDVLLSLGVDSVEKLVTMVESKEATAAASSPVIGGVKTGVKSLGQLSHDILVEMVQYHSNYKGKIPVRSLSAWQAWWYNNQTSLAVQ